MNQAERGGGGRTKQAGRAIRSQLDGFRDRPDRPVCLQRRPDHRLTVGETVILMTPPFYPY